MCSHMVANCCQGYFTVLRIETSSIHDTQYLPVFKIWSECLHMVVRGYCNRWIPSNTAKYYCIWELAFICCDYMFWEAKRVCGGGEGEVRCGERIKWRGSQTQTPFHCHSPLPMTQSLTKHDFLNRKLCRCAHEEGPWSCCLNLGERWTRGCWTCHLYVSDFIFTRYRIFVI